jgi:hypothetical protein
MKYKIRLHPGQKQSLYGHPAEMNALQDLAQDHNLAIIEDACQAHGAEYSGKKVGSFGIGTFSFYPTKNMTTGGGNNYNRLLTVRQYRKNDSIPWIKTAIFT